MRCASKIPDIWGLKGHRRLIVFDLLIGARYGWMDVKARYVCIMK